MQRDKKKIDNNMAKKIKELAPKPAKKSVVDFKNLPVIEFMYPPGGNTEHECTSRIVRVVEMNGIHIRGFEIRSEYDPELGIFKTYSRNKVGPRRDCDYNADIHLLHLTTPEE